MMALLDRPKEETGRQEERKKKMRRGKKKKRRWDQHIKIRQEAENRQREEKTKMSRVGQGRQQLIQEPLLHQDPSCPALYKKSNENQTVGMRSHAFLPSNYQEKVIKCVQILSRVCNAITMIWNMASGFLIQYNS